MPSHLEAALGYAARGWPVFPLQVRGKIPLIPVFRGGHGHRDATTDESKIREWWRVEPLANVGIRCAPESFCVIDVDPKNGGDKSYAELVAKHGEFPPTLRQVSGSGGIHYCFRPDPRIGSTISRVAKGIDTRGDNKGYIVAAPSVHPSGQPYQWENPGTPLASVPEWFVALLASKGEGPSQPTPAPQSAPAGTGGPTPAVEARARAYIRTCEPAVQGQGGHSKLLWACSAARCGFRLDADTAYRVVAEEYNPRCLPPWNLENTKDHRQFQHKIDEGAKHSGHSLGWLLGEYAPADDVGRRQAQEWADTLIERVSPFTPPAAPQAGQPGGPIDSILYPTGLLGDITSFINQTARKQQPLLALGNALAFCGTLFGRKVRDEWDLRTNIYVLGVADSGAGKEHSRQVIKRICMDAGIHDKILGGEEVTSDSALASALEGNLALLFQWDEIGHMISAIKDNGATGHRKSILPFIMRLTGAANTILLGKEYAGEEERRDLIQPNVCIYGTTVPEVFYRGFTSSEIRDGLLGRFLVMQVTNPSPSINDAGSKITQIPQDLIGRVAAWFKYLPPAPPTTGDITSIVQPFPVTVPLDPGAEEAYLALRADTERRHALAKKNADPCAPLWVRAEETARRVGLIVAAGDYPPGEARIGRAHAEYGCALALYAIREFVKAAAEHISDSESEKWAKTLQKAIRESGAKGLPKRELARVGRSLTPRQRDDAIKNLLEAEYIVKVPEGRGERYFMPPYGVKHDA